MLGLAITATAMLATCAYDLRAIMRTPSLDTSFDGFDQPTGSR